MMKIIHFCDKTIAEKKLKFQTVNTFQDRE